MKRVGTKRLVRWAAAGMLVISSVASVGCAARRHLDSAEAAAATGDMRGALYHYQRALGHQESLARDAEFMTKFVYAESRVAYDEAVRLRAGGHYELALDQLHLALRKDPGYDQPKQLMPHVLAEAARWRLGRALEAADGGNLSHAREHLEQALRHDLSNEDAAFAMASLSPDRLAADTPGLAAYRDGLSRSAEHRWDQAEGAYAQAVGNNPHLLPARAELTRSRAKLDASRRQTVDGGTHLAARQMAPAIASLNAALEVWPFNAQAQEMLASAQHEQQLADERFAEATLAAGERRWDDAISQADAGLAIDRSHSALGELRRGLPGRAAEDHTQQGDGLLASGKLDAARVAYDRALTYVRNHRAAQRGMAGVYLAYGDALERNGQLGAAMMHYTKGQAYMAIKPLSDGRVRTLAAIRDRIGMGLALEVRPAERGGDVSAQALQQSIGGRLDSYARSGLSTRLEQPPYALRVAITSADIDQSQTGSVDRTYRYIVKEWRPNPEYARVAECLHRSLADYERACRNYERAVGHGHNQHHNHEHDAHADHLYAHVQSTHREADRWRRELSRTPEQVRVPIEHHWPYTVETHTKYGGLHVTSELIDTTTGQAIEAFNSRAEYEASDELIVNANPAIGLHRDPLELPSDSSVRSALTLELANSAVPRAVDVAVQHRLGLLGEHAEQLREQGDNDTALEIEVDAAVLLGMVDGNGSSRAINTLIENYAK